MSYIIVDVESDGPIPNKYSMVCFGAIIVEPSLSKTFYAKTKPVSDLYIPESLAISGFSREEHELFDNPLIAMQRFKEFIDANSVGKPIFLADNLAYDWSFINYYFHYYLGENPFGWTGRRIGDLWCGFNNDVHLKWKHMRKTKHTHDPIDDARGNAEAVLEMQRRGLKIKLV